MFNLFFAYIQLFTMLLLRLQQPTFLFKSRLLLARTRPAAQRISAARTSSMAKSSSATCPKVRWSSNFSSTAVTDIDNISEGVYHYGGSQQNAAIGSMPRYPSLISLVPGSQSLILSLLRLSDYVGTAAFSMSGAVTASVVGMDLLGGCIVGTITAIGGGTLRDALILNRVPFWVRETEYLWISLVSALIVCIWWREWVDMSWTGPLRLKYREVRSEDSSEYPSDKSSHLSFLRNLRLYHGNHLEGSLLWLGDTIGISAFAVIGAMNGARLNCHPGICMVCGMMTATFGGLTRDVLCGLPQPLITNGTNNVDDLSAAKLNPEFELTTARGRILHSSYPGCELYATAALAGAGVYIVLVRAAVGRFGAFCLNFGKLLTPPAVSMGAGGRVAAGFLTAFLVRYWAGSMQIGLPVWGKSQWKVGRSGPDES